MKRLNRNDRSQSFSSVDSGRSASKRYRGLGTESQSCEPLSNAHSVTTSKSTRKSKLSSNFRPFANIRALAGGAGNSSESDDEEDDDDDDDEKSGDDSEAEKKPPKGKPGAKSGSSGKKKNIDDDGGLMKKVPTFQTANYNRGEMQQKVNEVVKKEESNKQASLRKEEFFRVKRDDGEDLGNEGDESKALGKRLDPFGDIEAEKSRLKKIKELKNAIKFPKFRDATDFELENVDNHVKAVITFDDDLADFRRYSFRNDEPKRGKPEEGGRKKSPGSGGPGKIPVPGGQKKAPESGGQKKAPESGGQKKAPGGKSSSGSAAPNPKRPGDGSKMMKKPGPAEAVKKKPERGKPGIMERLKDAADEAKTAVAKKKDRIDAVKKAFGGSEAGSDKTSPSADKADSQEDDTEPASERGPDDKPGPGGKGPGAGGGAGGADPSGSPESDGGNDADNAFSGTGGDSQGKDQGGGNADEGGEAENDENERGHSGEQKTKTAGSGKRESEEGDSDRDSVAGSSSQSTTGKDKPKKHEPDGEKICGEEVVEADSSEGNSDGKEPREASPIEKYHPGEHTKGRGRRLHADDGTETEKRSEALTDGDIAAEADRGDNESFASSSAKSDGLGNKPQNRDKPTSGNNETNKIADYWKAIKGTKI